MVRPKEDILHQEDVEAVIRTVTAPVFSTTTALADVDAEINTDDKYAGKLVINTTTGKVCWAVDATAAGVWKDAAGATAHSPA